MKACFATFLNTTIGQQCDPVAFLQSARNDRARLWRPAWCMRATMFAVMLVTLRVAAGVTHTDWKVLFVPALSLPLVVQMLCGFLIMILGEAQFWLLYAYSPPFILAAWLGGMGTLSPLSTWLGIQVGFSFLIGKMIADGSMLWTHQRLEKMRHEQQRLRGDHPSLVPSAIAAQLRTRRMRLWAALILACAILYLYSTLPASNLIGYPVVGKWARVFHASVSLGAGVAGCLGFDATLLAISGAIPPVRSIAGRQQATYIGRVALEVPTPYMRRFCISKRAVAEQGHIICILLTQGGLGPIVRRVCRTLSPAHLQELLLALSFHEGGSAAIRYLSPALPPMLQSIGLWYANLADEATKPPDLQRWIHVLTSPLTTMEAESLGLPHLLILSQVRDALLTVKATSETVQLLERLRRLVAQLNVAPSSTVPQETTWLSTVLWHLEQHQKRLQAG